MNWLTVALRKLLGMGARAAGEAAVDAIENHAGAVVPKPHKRHRVVARPIGERPSSDDDVTPSEWPRGRS